MRAAQRPVLFNLVIVVGGKSARTIVRSIEIIPIPFWRRRYRRPKIWRWKLGSWRVAFMPMMAGGAGTNFKVKEGGGLWSATSTWEEEVGGKFQAATKVPGKEDVVELLSTSGKLEVSTATTVECKEVKGANYKNTFNPKGSCVVKVFGNFTLGAEAKLTTGATVELEFANTAGTAEVNIAIELGIAIKVIGAGGTTKFVSAINNGSKNITVSGGTIDTNGQEVTCGKFGFATSTTGKLGASKIICNGTGEAWSVVEGTTIEAGTSTIELTDNTETAKKFHGGGKTYSTVILAGQSTEMQGSNTFTNLRVNTRGSQAKVTKFEKSSTTTITGEFTTNATEAEKVKITSSLAGKAWKLKLGAAKTIELTAVELEDSTGEGGGTFRDINGRNLGGNTGWTFLHEHTLTVSQSQTITVEKTPKRVLALTQESTISAPVKKTARVLTLSQSQSISAPLKSLKRILELTQSQTPTMPITVTRLMPSISQSQSITEPLTPKRILSAEQSQTVTMTHGLLVRTLSVSQSQTPTVELRVSRIFSTLSQSQTISAPLKTVTRILTASDSSTVSVQRSQARTLSTTQLQSCELTLTSTRILAISQGQTVSRTNALIRFLTVSQETSPSFVRSFSRSFALEQGQSISMAAGVLHGLEASQSQSLSSSKAVSRIFALSQSGALTMTLKVRRSLSASQEQTAEQTAKVEHHEHTKELSAEQTQSASVVERITRSLSVSQSQSVSYTRAVLRVMALTQAQAVSFTRSAVRVLSATGSSTPTLVRRFARTFSLSDTSSAVLVKRVLRVGVVSQTQEAEVETTVVHHPYTPGHLTSTVGPAITATSDAANEVVTSSTEPSIVGTTTITSNEQSSVGPAIHAESTVE
jgi:hypothetical protein